MLGITPPEVLKGGYTQSPLEGESFAASLTDPAAPGKDVQFYAMLGGQRSLYHDGWLVCSVHPPLSGWGGHFDKDVWELYHLAEDRAQLHDLADAEPERLETLKSLWFYYAGRYHGLPLDDRSALEQVLAERPPRPGKPRDHYVYYPDCADVPPEAAGVVITGRSYTIAAGVHVDSADAEGVLYAHGGIAGGHSLYIKEGRLRYAFNWVGTHLQTVVADRDLTPGAHVCTAEFAVSGKNTDPAMPGFAGTLTLYVDDHQVATGEIVTQPGGGSASSVTASASGATAPRRSHRTTCPRSASPGGTIDKVVVDVSGERYVDHEAQVRAWFSID